MVDFEQRYSAHSTKELLAIVNNPGKYQPAAIRAAKGVLASRNLAETEIETIKSELKNERDAEIKKENDKKVAAERLKNSVSKFASASSPISSSRTPVSKTIVIISIVFGFIALAQIVGEWSTIEFMFRDVHAKWDGEMLLFWGPMLFLPVAVALFALRKKAGWIMMALYMSGTIASVLVFTAWELLRTPSQYEFLLMPSTSPYQYVIGAIFYTATLFVICKATSREIFHVSTKTMIASILVGSIAVASMILQLFS